MPESLDARTLRRALEAYLEALREHREEIDSLNVYPVPDGDTGSNLVSTQEAVVTALQGRDGHARRSPSLSTLGETVSRASLMAARGNSGVILSQVFRGLFEALPDDGEASPRDLARALDHAAREAYAAVAHPEEGTVLTVLRDAGRAAVEAADGVEAVEDVVDAALAAGRASLARTRELHPELERAGVVDAGARGIVLLFDALRSVVRGVPLSEPVGPLGPVGSTQDPHDRVVEEFGYEVQYLLEADEPGIGRLRRELERIGDSLVVVGGGSLYNIHVHTDAPGQAVEIGLAAGRPRDITIVHLPDEAVDCMAGQARSVRLADQTSAVVAVTEGHGLRAAFRSLGALVVDGGPGNNPAVGGLLEAIEAAPSAAVLVLPNHPNVVAAAEHAASQSSKEVRVVRSTSVPAGLAAAAAFSPVASIEDNEREMGEGAAAVLSGSLVRAERDAETPTGTVRSGDWLVTVEDEVVAAAGTLAEAMEVLADRLRDGRFEIVTVIHGRDATPEDRAAVVRHFAEALADAEIQEIEGGQPRYAFLIGAE